MNLLNIAVQKKIELHCKTLINAIPMYKWLLNDEHLVDRGQDCQELGVKRAIQDAYESGRIKGKIVPVYK